MLAAPTDGRATTSLVLGIVSLVSSMCYAGFLFGIPAVILGVMSRREIARAGGAIGGQGVALGGIITGSFGAVISLGQICLVVGMWAFTISRAPHFAPPPMPPPATAYPTTTAPPTAAPAPPVAIFHVSDLHASGGALRAQVGDAHRRATAAKQKLLVMTSAAWSRDAAEIAIAWNTYDVQDAVKDVVVLRVDVDEFKGELAPLRMDKPDVPWFFLVGASLEPSDAISADEWSANTSSNIARVMRLFVRGALKTRTAPAPSGTAL